MENTNINQAGEQAATAADNTAAEKTFTQTEVDEIVREKLAQAKEPSEQEQKEKALTHRENTLYLREKALDVGLPDDIVQKLVGIDKETVDKVIDIIRPYLAKSREPIHNVVSPTGGAPQLNFIRQAMGVR